MMCTIARMQQKELRIALVCYGGVSLAVYMHGVTKELWHLARASRDFHADRTPNDGVETVYRDLLSWIERQCGVRLRVLPDILTGASAGGINAVFLAQAIHSGQSLEPLTDMWLEYADVDELIDPDARPVWRFAKFWAQPIAWWLLSRPGNVISESVAPETRSEVRRKVSAFIRGRWFQPPFSGDQFSSLLYRALLAMEKGGTEAPLLPPDHPLDLLVTATDFHGHREMLRLHSPTVVEETEHRLPIGFTSRTPIGAGANLANPLELAFAARATASFPGAFPALRIQEIEELGWSNAGGWPGRDAFLKRIMPTQFASGAIDDVSLIDGSVLVNAPFAGAMAALHGRPVHREVDRRFVYIDPRPDRLGSDRANGKDEAVGFFAAIFGSLSTIPREQPIRDNLEAIEQQSREAARNQQIVKALRPEVERAVESLFGRTLFLDRPSPRRLRNWRAKAQQAAANEAGYAFQSYAQTKFAGIVEELAQLVLVAAPELELTDARPIEVALRAELAHRGLSDLSAPGGGLDENAITFFRQHDIRFRIRRMRLLARRLARDWEALDGIAEEEIERARKMIYAILALYFERESIDHFDGGFRSGRGRYFRRSGRGARSVRVGALAAGDRRAGRNHAVRRAGRNAEGIAAPHAARLSGVSLLRCRNLSVAAERGLHRIRSGQGRPDIAR